MKRILSLITLVALFACGTALGAQEYHGHRPDKNGEHAKRFEELMSKKVSFMTDQLQLTPQEAEQFWPVYNVAERELWKAQKDSRRAIGALRKATKVQPDLSEEEILKLAGEVDRCREREIDLFNRLFKEVSKILPVKKAAKIYWIEEDFRQSLIRELRRGKGAKGKE